MNLTGYDRVFYATVERGVVWVGTEFDSADHGVSFTAHQYGNDWQTTLGFGVEHGDDHFRVGCPFLIPIGVVWLIGVGTLRYVHRRQNERQRSRMLPSPPLSR